MDQLHRNIFGILLICLGVIFVAPAIPAKVVAAIVGVYLIVTGIRLLSNHRDRF